MESTATVKRPVISHFRQLCSRPGLHWIVYKPKYEDAKRCKSCAYSQQSSLAEYHRLAAVIHHRLSLSILAFHEVAEWSFGCN